jgi:hypothetical protein
MTRHKYIPRLPAAALAAAALAAPAPSAAASVFDRSATDVPWPRATATRMEDLTDAEILASRGKGEPRPVAVADGGDGDAFVWAGLTVPLIALTATGLALHRRARAGA